jgi:hypothetical protein
MNLQVSQRESNLLTRFTADVSTRKPLSQGVVFAVLLLLGNISALFIIINKVVVTHYLWYDGAEHRI